MRSPSASTYRCELTSRPEANATSIITSKDAQYRITVLTEGLLRLEWSRDGFFEDRASVLAVNRLFPTVEFQLTDCDDGKLEVTTKRLRLSYDKRQFSTSGLSVQVQGKMIDWVNMWRYGQPVKDLGGTVRTLDEVDGRTSLGPSVISRDGFGLIDDSRTMLFTEDGWVAPRAGNDQIDIYLFVYGHDYREAMQAFYQLSGHQPLLPRWALGNWWSRFYSYSDREYLTLMDEFKRRNIPLSVAVIDMDWHLVRDPRIEAAGVSGWTGYTWNKTLFPSSSEFGKSLHQRGLKFTLNDHPADGIHSYEDQYEAMCVALNLESAYKHPITFDITNRAFCDAFYNVLHRDIEKESGCDFWWTDWQQGSYSRIAGIDPLWMLNHFGFQDNKSNPSDSQCLTFSRFAGPGSHRYPVGFSGDSIASWASLHFQPEFTNCAANIGYGWWSHDIGGHMKGKKDDELATRWVQYGVFSPIMRLHSDASEWNSKEPWRYEAEACVVQTRFLQLRHRLLPYLQAMNIRSSLGEPLCQPMYWDHPERNEAYKVPNQYMFGNSLLVAPVTSPQNATTNLACTKAWLPPGKLVDIFNGRVYEGDRKLWLHRPLDQYPVLALTGSIIPLDASPELQNGCPVPTAIELLVVIGQNASLELDENDAYISSKTSIVFDQQTGILTIEPAAIKKNSASPPRQWIVHFLSCAQPTSVSVLVDGVPTTSQTQLHPSLIAGFHLDLGTLPQQPREITVHLGNNPQLEVQSPLAGCREILHRARVEDDLKQQIWESLTAHGDESKVDLRTLGRLHAMEMDAALLKALVEVLTAIC